MRRTTVLLFLLFFLYTSRGHSFPQTTGMPPGVPPPQGVQLPGAPPRDDTGPVPSQMQKDLDKKANAQRHADLKRDTEKLLKLSTELKEYVDKSNENVLSLDVIKKADEIEKLAHSVKTKMRGDL